MVLDEMATRLKEALLVLSDDNFHPEPYIEMVGALHQGVLSDFFWATDSSGRAIQSYRYDNDNGAFSDFSYRYDNNNPLKLVR